MGLALHHDRSSRLSRRELSLRARTRDDGPTTLDDLTRRTLSELAERALSERTVIELPGHDERGPVLAVPLGSTSRPLGAVVVARDVGAPGYDAVAFEAIGALATNAGTALANIKDHQEVERLSVTDPLTGVNNFRHLSTMLAREMERATRFGHPLGRADARHRPLQAGQRHLRPRRGRRGAARAGPAGQGVRARGGHRRPLRRRGVRAAAARDRPGRRRAARRARARLHPLRAVPAAGRHAAGHHRLDGRRRLPRPRRDRDRGDGRGRRGAVPGEDRRAGPGGDRGRRRAARPRTGRGRRPAAPRRSRTPERDVAP